MGAPDLVRCYEQMLLIRHAEQRLASEFAAGSIPGSVHLYIGQEAVAVGVCDHLAGTDYITSTHRGHGHFIAKGGDVAAMFAEIWGKRTGVCRGMGGSMHVADVSKGILGANGIVAAGLAIATGAAFGAQLERAGRVAVCFFGDGAANQGVLMETLNVAALWKLPLVFVCENNTFSEFTPSSEITAGRISDRARPFSIPVFEVDGNDVEAVWYAAGEAIGAARGGAGPAFVEAHTYRIHGHMERERMILGGAAYRDDAEIESWRRRDPIDRLRARLEHDGIGLDELDARVAAVVDAAVAFAEQSDPADPALAPTLMFASGQRP